MDERLAELRRAVEEARSMPMSASVVVNRTELLALVDGVEEAVRAAGAEAARVLAHRDRLLEEAREEAAQVVADARAERERLASDSEVYRVAKRQAEAVLDEAQAESTELRKEIDDYVDSRLATFEITLERTREEVRRGRERIAGRSALDGLGDEVDQIVLPAHLERRD